MPEFHLQLLTVFLNFFRCLPKGASRRGEDHFRLCNSSSDSVYSVVALSCLAGAQRTNREVCLQMLLLHQGKNSGWHVRGVVHVRHLPVVLMFFLISAECLFPPTPETWNPQHHHAIVLCLLVSCCATMTMTEGKSHFKIARDDVIIFVM